MKQQNVGENSKRRIRLEKRLISLFGVLGLTSQLFLFGLLGCTRGGEEASKVTIRLPSSLSVNSASNVTSYSGTSDSWNTSLNPSATSDLNCYAVMVSGPGLDSSRCSATDNSYGFPVGIFAGAFPAGSQIELEIPSGTNRTFRLIGFKTSSVSTACVNLRDTQVSKSLLSRPQVVAEVETTLTPGSTTLNMTTSLSSKFFDDCQGPAFGGGIQNGSATYFGDGTVGDKTISSTFITSNTYVPGTSQYFNPARRVAAITNVNGQSVITTGTSFGSTDFVTGDEIFWIVNAASGATPDSTCATDGTLFRGRYGFAKIMATASGTSVTLDQQITNAPAASGVYTNSIVSPSGSMCAMQIVRVPNFNNLTIDSTSAALTISPNAYNETTGIGGILIFRVKGTLSLIGANTITFDATSKGFPSGANATSTGVGIRGGGVTANNNLDNAGGYTNANESSGGGHIGAGGGSANATANTWGFSLNSMCSGGNCTPHEKIYFGGGAGGNGSGTYGRGGGIIFIQAKTIDSPEPSFSAVRSFSANGGAGSVSSTAQGGGAGGTVFIRAQTIDRHASSDYLKMNSTGGNGVTFSIYNSGGGGGGNIEVNHCAAKLGGVISNGVFQTTATGGSSGGGTSSSGGSGRAYTGVASYLCGPAVQ